MKLTADKPTFKSLYFLHKDYGNHWVLLQKLVCNNKRRNKLSRVFQCGRKEAFEHNNSCDTFFIHQLLLNQFTLVNYFDIHQDAASQSSTKCYLNSEKEIFHSREEGKSFFTARLTSMILQKNKIGFKVELKYVKVIVIFAGVISTDKGIFFRKANDASNKYGK